MHKSIAQVTPGKHSPGWDRNAIIEAVYLDGKPHGQAKIFAGLRKAQSDSPENQK